MREKEGKVRSTSGEGKKKTRKLKSDKKAGAQEKNL